jgi:hypothetical protein
MSGLEVEMVEKKKGKPVKKKKYTPLTNKNSGEIEMVDKKKEKEEEKEEEKEREEEEKEEKEEEKDDEESGVKPVKEKKYTPGEIEMVDLYKKEEKEEKETGFRETLVFKNDSTGPKKLNTKLCPQIFNIGKKVNNKFFIPSQFPNLTKKKSLLKGGRKHMKTKNRNRKGISRTEISRKGISRNKRKSVKKNLAL